METDANFTPPGDEEKKSAWGSKARSYLLYLFLSVIAIVVLGEAYRSFSTGEAFNMELFTKVLDGIIAFLGT